MGQKSIKISENQEFLNSERWKCEKSPTGAHYWMIHCNEMTCKYCQSSKPVNTGRSGWPKPEAK